MKRIIGLALVAASLLPAQSLARSCNTYERDKAEYFAEKAGEKLISGYGGGQDERINIASCEYNSYSEIYKLKIEVYWNGSIFRENNYNVDGVLKLKSDGTDVDFSQTYANQNVKDLSFFKTIAIGTFALGALSAEAGSSSSGYRIKFTNNCDRALKLAINYKNMSGNWTSKGWWLFEPNKGAYLQSNGASLRTNSATLYYYVKPNDGSYLGFDGEYAKTFDGSTLRMRKIEDNSGDTDWSVTCN